jgi:DNA-binding winged helix-turn-helix (wHTH) protein
MSSLPLVQFGPFRLDPINACLWRGAERLSLPPRDFAVLQYLVTHPGQLVTKEEMLQAVWSNIHVSDAALKTSIQRLRHLLGDDPKTPRFIETVHRRGYRFIGLPPIAVASEELRRSSAPNLPSQITPEHPLAMPPFTRSVVVGREAELHQLVHW